MNSPQLAHEVILSWRDAPVTTPDLTGSRRPASRLGPDVVVPAPTPAPPEHDLLGALQRRRSTRFFGTRALPATELFDLIAGGLSREQDAREDEGPELPPVETIAVVFRVDGLEPGLYTVDPVARTATPSAPLPTGRDLHDFTLQSEFCDAAVILSFGVDLGAATATAGTHGYRLLMQRASAAAYSMWVDGVRRGWTGSVFAGMLPAALRLPLGSDGATRHQLFALALGHPAFPPVVAPISPAPAHAGAGASSPARPREEEPR